MSTIIKTVMECSLVKNPAAAVSATMCCDETSAAQRPQVCSLKEDVIKASVVHSGTAGQYVEDVVLMASSLRRALPG